ncbi:hypothetical protein N5C46_15005 [Rossellomorea vietnamensis]|uniref:Uncharacterized protein n=1 Tax=Rossellomorea vietnamensis TaxID=218284 RepID=A0ACD4C3L0_9BACI|nr:hypothetical protein [Rossellomorea vietnamensis]UXH42992.1 hypothetical protein N5C46_15005 [Rossellomorea vietnamensis]
MFNKKKMLGFILMVIVMTLISFSLSGINIPLPSAFVPLMIAANCVFAFISIFTQRLIIALYEVNVFEEKDSLGSYFYKYVAIFTSGINYYVQNVLNRLPFLVNKLLGLGFFISLMWIGFGIVGIFD